MNEKEGIVKYFLEFKKEKLDITKEYKSLEVLRKRLYSLALIGAYEDGIGYGNISLKSEDENSFIITGTQTGCLQDLEEKDYSKVLSIDFNNFKTKACGLSHPSSECISHGTIYNLDKEIKAVIHIHNKKLWHFMIENNYLSTEDTPYGTLEMVEDIRNMYKNKNILENNIFVMKGHYEGIICFAKSLEAAEYKLYDLVRKVL